MDNKPISPVSRRDWSGSNIKFSPGEGNQSMWDLDVYNVCKDGFDKKGVAIIFLEDLQEKGRDQLVVENGIPYEVSCDKQKPHSDYSITEEDVNHLHAIRISWIHKSLMRG